MQRPYRILHVIDSLGASGGAEQQLASNLRHFTDPQLEHSVAYLHTTPSVDRHREVAEAAAGVYPLSIPGERRIGRAVILRRLLRVVDHVDADLIHCTLAEACLAARLAAVWRGIPLVESLVNIGHESIRVNDNPNVTIWKLRAHKVVDRVTMRWVTRFHALSNAVSQSWQDTIGIPESKVQVIPRGVDVKRLQHMADIGPTRERLLDDLGLSPNSSIILNVGRQEPQKGQRYLIEAMAEVLTARPEAALIIAGREGNSTGDLRRKVQDLGIGDSVRFLGATANVAALFRAADIFVFPSLFEGLGVSLLEAMALGVPVVATNIEPLDELCEGGLSGWLVERKSPTSLASAIKQLLIEPGARSRLQERGRVRAEDFQIATASDELQRMYLGLLVG